MHSTIYMAFVDVKIQEKLEEVNTTDDKVLVLGDGYMDHFQEEI